MLGSGLGRSVSAVGRFFVKGWYVICQDGM